MLASMAVALESLRSFAEMDSGVASRVSLRLTISENNDAGGRSSVGHLQMALQFLHLHLPFLPFQQFVNKDGSAFAGIWLLIYRFPNCYFLTNGPVGRMAA